MAAIVAEIILIQQNRGISFSQGDICDITAAKQSTITLAIKELRTMGLMAADSYDLNGYKLIVSSNKKVPTTELLKLQEKVVNIFNSLGQTTYRQGNKTILNFITGLLKHREAKRTVKGLSTFDTLALRIEAVVVHKWRLSEQGQYDKKFVRPATLLRSPSKFYDEYVEEARSYHLQNR